MWMWLLRLVFGWVIVCDTSVVYVSVRCDVVIVIGVVGCDRMFGVIVVMHRCSVIVVANGDCDVGHVVCAAMCVAHVCVLLCNASVIGFVHANISCVNVKVNVLLLLLVMLIVLLLLLL